MHYPYIYVLVIALADIIFFLFFSSLFTEKIMNREKLKLSSFIYSFWNFPTHIRERSYILTSSYLPLVIFNVKLKKLYIVFYDGCYLRSGTYGDDSSGGSAPASRQYTCYPARRLRDQARPHVKRDTSLTFTISIY